MNGKHEAAVRIIGSTVVTEFGSLRQWYGNQRFDLSYSRPALLTGSPSFTSLTPTPDGTPPSGCINGRRSGSDE